MEGKKEDQIEENIDIVDSKWSNQRPIFLIFLFLLFSDFMDDYGGEDFEISASGQDAGDDRFD